MFVISDSGLNIAKACLLMPSVYSLVASVNTLNSLSKGRSEINNLCLPTRSHQLDSINILKYSKTYATQSSPLKYSPMFAVIVSFSIDQPVNEVKHD